MSRSRILLVLVKGTSIEDAAENVYDLLEVYREDDPDIGFGFIPAAEADALLVRDWDRDTEEVELPTTVPIAAALQPIAGLPNKLDHADALVEDEDGHLLMYHKRGTEGPYQIIPAKTVLLEKYHPTWMATVLVRFD